MNVLFTILTVLIIIAALLLIGVVLLQNGKGDGMASNFVAGNQTFGVRQTADILEKFTWGLVTFILILSVVSAFTLTPGNSSDGITKKIEQATTEQPIDFSAKPVEQKAPAAEVPATEDPATEANAQ